MIFHEHAFLFPCGDDELVGVLAVPESSAVSTGVLVVVGGPQYRVGSHRQFVALSRSLAAEGVSVMRFDYRGMGDSSGEQRSFLALDDDIRAAVDAFLAHAPDVRRVVLWGLCDGASAACLYAPHDERVAGLVLLNPWVRTEAGEARTRLKHYYLERLLDAGFWKKLLGGGVKITESLGGLLDAARSARSGGAAERASAQAASPAELPERLAASLHGGGKPFVVILSGRDYVAREFEQAVRCGQGWSRLSAAQAPIVIDEADHTFSSARWREEVARISSQWVQDLQVPAEVGES